MACKKRDEMSVITTADEKIAEAKNSIMEANILLLAAINPKTWGYNDYNSDFIESLHDAIKKLREIQKLLGD